MNVWYINSMLGTLRLEEEDDALCGVQLCPDGVPDLEPGVSMKWIESGSSPSAQISRKRASCTE